MNVRPLPPQLTWVRHLVRFACFHTGSAPGHLLPELFSSTVSACSVFVCGKNCSQIAFGADSGVALSAETRTEFFLPHSKIRKWSALWSPALHCICRQPVSILSVTQTVVKSIARRISFCDAVDKEKGFEIPAVTLNPAHNPVSI